MGEARHGLLKLFMYILHLRTFDSQDSGPINSQLLRVFSSAIGCPQLPSSALNMLFRSIATVLSAALFAQSACALTSTQIVTSINVAATVSESITTSVKQITPLSSASIIISNSKVIVIRLLNRRGLNPPSESRP